MNNKVRRIFVEKAPGFNVEGKDILEDLELSLGITSIKKLRIVNRYDVEGINDEQYEKARLTIFSEPSVDFVYDEQIEIEKDEKVFAVEFLPGQYDQRADSASESIKIITQQEKPALAYAKLYILKGDINEEEFSKIKNYCINRVDSRQASLIKPISLKMDINPPKEVETLENFISMKDEDMEIFWNENGFAMSFQDIKFCRDYFKNEEKRNPTITEIKVIDTYWSDHCRHTTFMTNLENIEIEDGKYTKA
ncbi:MAG: phosphoribosylformylglycinamidine synthase, partial [Clostridiaceae bacterium]